MKLTINMGGFVYVGAGTDVTLLGKPKIGTLVGEMFKKRLNDHTKNRVLIIAFFCFLAQAYAGSEMMKITSVHP